MFVKRVFLAALLACVSIASAQSRLVYDSRLIAPEPRITESQRARVKALAGLAMQAGLWDTEDFQVSDDCTGEDFRIIATASGSFTVKVQRQTAILYLYCSDRSGWSQGVVILQGQQAVAHYVFTSLASSMRALEDVNRNGFSELMLEGGYTGQGYTEGYVEIAELRPQRRVLGRLDHESNPPYQDDCGARENGTWSSRVVRVLPGTTPKFTQQVIQGKCGNHRKATFEGDVRPLTLKPSPTGWLSAPIR